MNEYIHLGKRPPILTLADLPGYGHAGKKLCDENDTASLSHILMTVASLLTNLLYST